MKYSDRHLAGLSAGPPDRVELIDAGSLGYGTGPSFGRGLTDKLPSPNHSGRRVFLVFKNLHEKKNRSRAAAKRLNLTQPEPPPIE